MKLLALVIAVAAVCACGSMPPVPAGGPKLPAGAHPLTLKQLSALGPNDVGPDIIASTSLSQVRSAVVAHARFDRFCAESAGPADRCWGNVPDSPGQIYIAVITNSECTSPVSEMTGISASTVYFIHWIGKSQRVCNMAMALAMWRLYSVARSDLPRSGSLTVRLEIQGSEQGVVESQVALT